MGKVWRIGTLDRLDYWEWIQVSHPLLIVSP